MRARAGDPPRTMPQKVLAGRAADASLHQDFVDVKVDQVILTRAPGRALAEAQNADLKKTPVEVAVAYDGMCVTHTRSAWGTKGHSSIVAAEFLSHGILLARPGVGFPGPVHLERFASPARLAVTDDPRLCFVGGIGMLSMVIAPGQLGKALATGSVTLRMPRSIQVLLSGRMRPFVCARDVTLELIRRGLEQTVRRIDEQYGAPVVIEFAGPSARLLSVPERAVLCAIAPAVGASSALFVSDEKSEVFLRDQRRSKAHRSLAPDPGAPCDDVLSIDLATVDPLLQDEDGDVRQVRDLAGKPIHQVILGGDSGVTLRDMLASAALLKSKRVPPRLDLLVAPPSRQIVEVMASEGALVDLVATGARLIEPDQRVITGELYPPKQGETSLRSFDAEPHGAAPYRCIIASAETIAYSVATGHLGDPRSFKRPVRVTVPRVFPTEDVLIARPRKSETTAGTKTQPAHLVAVTGWKDPVTLNVHHNGAKTLAAAVVADNLDQVRAFFADAALHGVTHRALIAPFIPSTMVSVLSGLGIGAFIAEQEMLKLLHEANQLSFPAAHDWSSDGAVSCKTETSELVLKWLAKGMEKNWITSGTSRPPHPKK